MITNAWGIFDTEVISCRPFVASVTRPGPIGNTFLETVIVTYFIHFTTVNQCHRCPQRRGHLRPSAACQSGIARGIKPQRLVCLGRRLHHGTDTAVFHDQTRTSVRDCNSELITECTYICDWCFLRTRLDHEFAISSQTKGTKVKSTTPLVGPDSGEARSSQQGIEPKRVIRGQTMYEGSLQCFLLIRVSRTFFAQTLRFFGKAFLDLLSLLCNANQCPKLTCACT